MKIPASVRRAAATLGLFVMAALAVTPVASQPEAQASTAAPTKPLEVGVEVFSMWRDWSVNAQMLDRVAQSGSDWVRVGVGWCSLEEKGPGVVSAWYQDRLDTAVVEAGRRDLKVLLTLGCTPTWAGGTSFKSLPTDQEVRDHYERVAQYLARRYRGQVEAWEIWNEPDCSTGTCPQTDPATYVPVLQAGYRGIKAGDPDATVVSGGISGANADWIRRMYAAGGRGHFDALAIHPYQLPASAPPEAPAVSHPYRMTAVERIRDVMVAHGDADKPIWFTEFGWTTATGTGDKAGVDEATQAEYVRRSIMMIEDWYPYVTHAFWFTIRDRDDWTPYENQFGLLHVDGTPKPALDALRQANQWLDSLQGTYTRTLTVEAEADTLVRQQYLSKAYGKATTLNSDSQEADGNTGSRATSYLRFNVPALPAAERLSAAALSLAVTNASVNGPEVWRTATSWNEGTMTWTSGQPRRLANTPAADFGPMPLGRMRAPVTGVMPGSWNSFQLYADSSDGVDLASREATNLNARPRLQLVVRTG